MLDPLVRAPRLEHAEQPAAPAASRCRAGRRPAGDRDLLPPLLQHPRPPRPDDRRGSTRRSGTTTRAGVTLGAPKPRATISAGSSRTCRWSTASTGVGVDDDVPGRRTSGSSSGIRSSCARRTCRRPWTSSTSRAASARPRPSSGTRQRTSAAGAHLVERLALQWVQPDDFRYLDRGYYDDAGTVELRMTTGVSARAAAGASGSATRSAAGWSTIAAGSPRPGGTRPRPVLLPRPPSRARRARSLDRRLDFGLRRLFAGAAGGDDERGQAAADLPPGRRSARAARQSVPPLARRAAGGRRLPLSRSRRRRRARRGPAALDRVHRRARSRARADRAGPARRRGSSTGSASRPSPIWRTRSAARPRRRSSDRIRFLGDAGIGIRADHRIGDTRFVTRFDLPLWFSRPEVAHDRSPGDDEARVPLGLQLRAGVLSGAARPAYISAPIRPGEVACRRSRTESTSRGGTS